MQTHHDPETLQAIRVMAQTPVYFQGGKIVFEENGGVELYRGDDLVDELPPAKDDAAVVALTLWRELNTMPETILEKTLQDAHFAGRVGGKTMLETLVKRGKTMPS